MERPSYYQTEQQLLQYCFRSEVSRVVLDYLIGYYTIFLIFKLKMFAYTYMNHIADEAD